MSRFKALGGILALAMALFSAMAQTSVTNEFTPNLVVPDGDPAGVSDTRSIDLGPNPGQISSLQVILTLSSGFAGDYYATLVHGNGFAVLLNRPGRTLANTNGYPETGFDVVFDDTGYDIHNYRDYAYQTNPDGELVGTWASDGREVDPAVVLNSDARTALLASFNGGNPNGDWTLFLSDLDFGDEGTLVKWGLVITTIPEPSTSAVLLLGAAAAFLRRRR